MPRSAQNFGPITVDPGPFSVVTLDGPADGVGVMAVSLFQPVREAVLTVPGFEQLLPWHGSFAFLLETIRFDAAGRASADFVHPGFGRPVDLWFQSAFVDEAGEVLGSSERVRCQLR